MCSCVYVKHIGWMNYWCETVMYIISSMVNTRVVLCGILQCCHDNQLVHMGGVMLLKVVEIWYAVCEGADQYIMITLMH